MTSFFKRRFLLGLLLSLLVIAGTQAQSDLEDAPYKDPSLPIDERVDDLLGRMTLEEKIGQMTLVEVNSLQPEIVRDHFIGAILSGGGGYPTPNTVENWALRTDTLQQAAMETRLQIPMMYGVDAIHGHNNVRGAVIYPHNIGLGATGDAELVRLIGQATACDMLATGIQWDYAPVLAVPQDIRWGRTYEAFGQDTELVTELGVAYIEGLQGDDLASPTTVAATPKHFVADGATMIGTSRTNGYLLDQGNASLTEEVLREVHLAPYEAAIAQGAQIIMASYSSWNNKKLHGQAYLLTDVLKGEMGFEGFIVSDWAGVDQVSSDYYDAVVTSINAGIDMNMVPSNFGRFITVMEQAVEDDDIIIERIDDAVRRILRVKFMLGLFENPYTNPDLAASFGSDAARELAREAVARSAVLLKNDADVLPLSTDLDRVFIAGDQANSVGIQSGGWTLEWQGTSADLPGTTIAEGIQAALGDRTQVFVDRDGVFEDATDEAGHPLRANVGVVVIGERPYAEGVGDVLDLALSEDDMQLIADVRERSDKLIIVLVSGRPLLINQALDYADAFIAAWLPGSEGAGIADVIFGERPFSGVLPMAWPRDMAQVPLSALESSEEPPLFPYGYGLTTAGEPAALPQITCGSASSQIQTESTEVESTDVENSETERTETPSEEVAMETEVPATETPGPDLSGLAVSVNQIGYYPDAPKFGMVANSGLETATWALLDVESGAVVSEGVAGPATHDAASGDELLVVDFSPFSTPGTYQLNVQGAVSAPFRIGEDVYRDLSVDALRYFYLSRSGIELDPTYAGDYARQAGHMTDDDVICYQGTDAAGASWPGCDYVLNARGGWYDAGDYGKYVVNGGISAWTLLNLYERVPSAYPDGSLNIPESGNGVSDLLDEARWEVDFLLSMQVPEGQPQAGMVHHKLHDLRWGDIPEKPPTEYNNDNDHQSSYSGRYVYPPSTTATYNMAAVAAQCARIWQGIDDDYAERCLNAAVRAFDAADENPIALAGNTPGEGGGNYDDVRPQDEKYWAAAELFVTTGDTHYLEAMQSTPYLAQFGALYNDGAMTWGDTAALGTLSILLHAASLDALDAETLTTMQEQLISVADDYLARIASEGYRLPMRNYVWGSNSVALNNAIILAYAYDQTGDLRYLGGVTETMDYILGRNTFAFSFVTGYGTERAQHPHHRFWANEPGRGFPAPPPGVVVGGPNADPSDPTALESADLEHGPARRYVDLRGSWSTNEVTINWNAPLAWVAGYLNALHTSDA
ncbi:glycoside hydrolase family 9 protein [Phototrophicus methaneseepsis]|uniref:Endoglucanase n=1 Tax=Phototrophicus methaneseepsis TaxID=2710758 RepID=A0A7S8ED03_9CHLR|nr:glycoside hydrolase family 9 protein [Phototrophicus methaneseepsis]QPC84707.1 glycoside hydrolase family 9 protein [Phototrophicus methaneseepsis]